MKDAGKIAEINPGSGVNKNGGFKKNYASLKKTREFQFLFRKGRSYATYAFICYNRLNALEQNRLGVVASKKVGNAVERARAKRVLREAFRVLEPELRAKTDKRFDFAFIAVKKTPELKSTRICELMKELFDKLAV